MPVLAGAGPVITGPITTDAQIIAALNLDAPGLEKVKSAVKSGDVEKAKLAYLDYRRHASPAKYRMMPSDEPSQPTASDDPKADLVVDHKVTPTTNADSLSKFIDMGKDFNWTYNPFPASDPRYTDEFTYCTASRTQFWEQLADGYWKTHDEKYAAAWVNQLLDFAAKNPVPQGKAEMFGNAPGPRPSTWRTLDSAIRMFDSWPYAYYHFLNSPSFTPEAQWTYLKSIHEHGVRLHEGLSDPNRTGNWVTAEAYGLYTIGVLFPELRESSEWRQFALDRFSKELDRMVAPDGFEEELTPGYHTVTIDEFKGPIELAKLNHLEVPANFQTKVLSMYRALVLVMAQNGKDVPTNDSWDVNAVSLAKQGLKVGDDPLLRWAATGGKEGTAPPDSTMLPYAGFYAMRSGWKPDDMFLFFRGGPIGIGHQHEDMLEVVMRAWNRTLLLDPGTYTYDHSEERRYVLGTSAHNTIIVDGNWQHRGAGKPFPPELTNPWVATPLFDYAAATYDGGYQKNVYAPKEYSPLNWVGPLDKSISHTRRVLFLKPYYALVLDTLDGSGHHVFDAHFHLDAPAAEIDPASKAAFSKRTDGVNLGLYPLDSRHLEADVVQGQKEPMLGWYPVQHRTIPTVRFRKVQNAPATFATFLYPYKGEADADFEASPLTVRGKEFWGQTIDTAHEQAEVVVSKDGKANNFSFDSDLLGKVNADVTGIILRRPIGKSEVFIGGIEVHAYSDNNIAFLLKNPASIVVREAEKDSPIFFNGQSSSMEIIVSHPFKANVTLAPGVWTEITSKGSRIVYAPAMFSPLAP